MEKNKKEEKAKIIYHRPTFETYTPCTLENFLAWKAKFDDELARLKSKNPKDDETKLTGKQFFLKNKDHPLKEPEEEEEEEDEDDEDEEVEDIEYNEGRYGKEEDDQKPFK